LVNEPGGSNITYQYDTTNQLRNDGVTSLTYDQNGNRIASTATATLSYDPADGNQLQDDGAWTYTYDLEGNLTQKDSDSPGPSWTYGYDQANHLVSAKRWSDNTLTVLEFEADYKYDPFGNRIETDTDSDGVGGIDAKQGYALDGWKTGPQSANPVGL